LIQVTDNVGNRGSAFVPDHLPPKRDFGTKSLRAALSEADRALARLEGTARQIQRPDVLFRNFLRREAVLSSKIEGTRTTLADLLLYEAVQESRDGSDDQAVANYLDAFDYGRARCAQLPVGRRLFDEMHAILMRGTEVAKTTPGRIRDCLVVIGEPPPDNARFVPPPELFVPELLENLELYLKNDDEPPLIKLAIAHYQFETIHPFRDGNGRLGRMLISLWLQRERILTEPMLYLSAYFERHRSAYYDAMLSVSTRGTWEDWLLFFFDAVKTQSIDAEIRTQRLVALRQEYHERLKGARVPQNLHFLIDALFVQPVLSVPIACKILGITYPPAKKLMERLVEARVLDAETVVVRGTTYYFGGDLLSALSAPVAPDAPQGDAR
jgi:Fic family protein